MQGGRRGRDSFFEFGDPFAGFGGFGSFGQGSLLPSFFGGRDPFDDPFFTRPFGSPFGSLFPSNFLVRGASPFADAPATGFLEHQQPPPNKPRGPIIEELNSDDEKAEDEGPNNTKDNPRKHSRSKNEPYVEDPDDEAQEKKSKHIQYRNPYNGMMNMQPQPQSRSFSFQSSTVTYGGADGASYAKSITRRSGSDGVMFEDYKEADSSTGQATHRVSKGLKNKGHSFTRKLKSDGSVNTMQTLHNLNEDELTGFEEAWKGKARKHFPGWDQRLLGHDNFGGPSSGSQSNRGGWALPSTEHSLDSSRLSSDTAAATAPFPPPAGRRSGTGGSQGRTRA
ncbi:hypothetical protein Nepgr_031668 [Nepenthes gracilis]|uniref:Myeloid leukemia factor 1 n=1 Tax=Nepenthes gracilis TaxID=150966 RepID=A0AAD3TH61_NEPGR|nr:hypothetical protein Nepgr_031668 [Nepenthes gracilis]